MSGTTIELFAYDPAWPGVYTQQADAIRAAIGSVALALHHVGSTSVPGLSAKPVIDIILATPDSTDEASYVPALEAGGYRFAFREPAWFEHRMLKRVEPVVNLHVFTAGCDEIDRMLRFRDWLRTHDDDRVLYEDTKRHLATRTWGRVQDYADAKTDVVKAILSRAEGRG